MRRTIRKFADRQRTDKEQAENSSNTEATLILCGWWGERANNRGDSTIKEEDEEKKNEKICLQSSRQTDREQFKH